MTLIERDPEILNALEDAFAKGASIPLAATCAAISAGTVYQWFERGRAGEEPYRTVYLRMQRARSNHHLRLLDKISNSRNWQSAAWLLERIDPETYARPNRLDVTVAPGQAESPDRIGEQLKAAVQRLDATIADPATPQERQPDLIAVREKAAAALDRFQRERAELSLSSGE